jgi:phospholipid/cholesterol/gamma-HCH transport system permease protein
LQIPVETYLNALQVAVHFGDIMHGLIKTFFFATIIIIIACNQGFKANGGAEGVGEATTKTVVYASIAILVSDYFLTLFISYTLGI